MKTIMTAYGSFTTGTELADAVTRYGVALARTHAVDVVDLPFTAADGMASRVQLRVGWLCDMATVSRQEARGDLEEDDTVRALRERTEFIERRRTPSHLIRSVKESSLRGQNWEEII